MSDQAAPKYDEPFPYAAKKQQQSHQQAAKKVAFPPPHRRKLATAPSRHCQETVTVPPLRCSMAISLLAQRTWSTNEFLHEIINAIQKNAILMKCYTNVCPCGTIENNKQIESTSDLTKRILFELYLNANVRAMQKRARRGTEFVLCVHI
jgi:hypothetical protein